MKKGVLYVKRNGFEVTNFSHSQARLYDRCGLKYKFERIDGWKRRYQNATVEFGRVFERALK